MAFERPSPRSPLRSRPHRRASSRSRRRRLRRPRRRRRSTRSSPRPGALPARNWRRSTSLGDRVGARLDGRRGHHAARLEGSLPALGGSRLERDRRAGGMGRTGPADRRPDGGPGNLERRRSRLRRRPDADRRRHRRCSPRTARDELKRRYLPKLVAGEWMATMNLTEPQAGSDLGGAHDPGGARRGRHLPHLRPEDLHHLWRARLHRQHRPPGAGAPRRRARRHAGISLFLVPKILVNDDGSLGAPTTSPAPASSTSSACTARRPARWSMASAARARPAGWSARRIAGSPACSR